jgi:uridine kinase
VIAPDPNAVAEAIVRLRRLIPAGRAVLAAVSGIDGCGKGFVSRRIADALRACGLRTAVINIDGWLNLPHRRFSDTDPAEHFYRHAIRFDEMFAQLVLPLRAARSLRLEADCAEETATRYRKHRYAFDDVDVILLEGIYLLQRRLRAHYDCAVWILCSFDTALERAIARAQEGLPPAETVVAYRRIYFPAQQIHFARDQPQVAADMTIVNDPRLAAAVAPHPNPVGQDWPADGGWADIAAAGAGRPTR